MPVLRRLGKPLIYVMMARWPFAGGNDILGQGGSGFINQLCFFLFQRYFVRGLQGFGIKG